MIAVDKQWKTGFIMALCVCMLAPGLAITFVSNHLAPGFVPLGFTVVVCYLFRRQLFEVIKRPELRWPVLILTFTTAGLSALNEHFREVQSSVIFVLVPVALIAAYLIVALRTAKMIYGTQAEP